MLEEARNQKLKKRVEGLLDKYNISEDSSYSIQEKDNIYQCVIRYQRNNKWNQFWISTGFKVERGNLRKAKSIAEEMFDTFRKTVKEKHNNQNQNNCNNILDFQGLAELNTTSFNPNKCTKADWDFYEFMEFWLENVIIKTVSTITYSGYKRLIRGRLKEYFSNPRNAKKVKEITADDLDSFYDYLRKNNLSNGTIDHYNDNISSAFKYLLRKKLVRYNPTDLIVPITVNIVERPTYTRADIFKLFEVLKGDIIELPTLIDGYYGLRRSEIFGLREMVFDFENNNFIVNHVALQNNDKDNKENLYFQDRTKSKKGCRILPLFPEVKEAILRKLDLINKNKELFGDSYNHKYDGYICVQDNGDLIKPGYFTKRFAKIIEKNNLKKITPHGLRHSIATLLHIEGVDIRDLQDWLGHQNISSTNRYTRSDYKKQQATGDVVEKIFKCS